MNILNSSTYELTDTQTTLLANSLTFCPTMKGHIFVKDIYLFAKKLVFQVFHNRKKTVTPLGPLGDWYSLTRLEYCTLRDLVDLWEEGHVDQQEDTEVDPENSC